MQVRSCGLVTKRDGVGRAVEERRTEEKAMGAGFMGVLMSHDSRVEMLRAGRDEQASSASS